MPRSKRNQVVSLTQTNKKTKAAKGELITTIREQADLFAFVWVFDVEHMRTIILQEVRAAWKGSRSAHASTLMRKGPRAHKANNHVGSLWDETPSCVKHLVQRWKMSAD